MGIKFMFEKWESLKKIDVRSEAELRRRFEEILAINLNTKENLKKFQEARDLLYMHITNEFSESYFLMSQDVLNEENKKRYEYLTQVIDPIANEYSDKLNELYLNSPLISKEDLLARNLNSERLLFNPLNIEINKEISLLSAQITEIDGQLKAVWRGKEVALNSIKPYIRSSDRNERKEAYDIVQKTYLDCSDEIDAKFDNLLKLRFKLAKNAGFDSYTDYRFLELKRFEWGVADCFKFHDAVKKYFLPIQKKLNERRKKNLKLESLRPYDLRCDEFGKDPIRLCHEDNTNHLIEVAGYIVKSIDGELYDYFKEIKNNQLFDIETRKNKAPGGYMLMYPLFEQASIFYSTTGVVDDLLVVMHELGHCFHYFLSKDIRPFDLQACPAEVAEVGSTVMEFLALEKLSPFLNESELERAKNERLRFSVELIILCAQVDEFQHWLYANPFHEKEDRINKWIELTKIYSPDIDVQEDIHLRARYEWQFFHILQVPYYYIDYAISEMLALNIWGRFKTNPKDAIESYKNGCRVSGSKTVSETYKLFGSELDFGEIPLAILAKNLEDYLFRSTAKA